MLDLSWADHRLTEATLVATVDGPLRVLSRDPLAALTEGSEVFTESTVPTTIDVRAGQRVRLCPLATVVGDPTSGGST